ncbi:MAG: phosphopantetheine-binding protein [Gammaproteobacteria bacterium]
MIRNVVVALIEQKHGCEASKLTDDMRLADLGMDSLKAITLLYDLEEKLGLEIPNEAIDRIETLGDVVDELTLISQRA